MRHLRWRDRRACGWTHRHHRSPDLQATRRWCASRTRRQRNPTPSGSPSTLSPTRSSRPYERRFVIPERPEQGGKRRGRRRRPQTPLAAEAPPQPEDLTSLTVAALKERLKDAGLPVSGTKSALIERLQAGPEESTLPMPDPATIEDVLRRLEGTLLDRQRRCA